MAKKKLRTNEDLVRDLMNYSPYGGLCQAFITTAIEKYCEAVIKAGPEQFDSSMLNGATWVGIAQDTKTRMDAFYGRHEVTEE